MYAVLRPRGQSGCLRWHSYGFDQPEDVVEAMINGYLNNPITVRHFDFEQFKGWEYRDGSRAAGYKDINQQIARQLMRTCMWQDHELPAGCRDFIDAHYDGGMPAVARKTPHLIYPAE